MVISGEYNPSHIVKEFLGREYAFTIGYSTGVLVNVGHHKGVWYLAKIKDKKVVDYFELEDCFSFIRAENDMTRGLIDAQTQVKGRLYKDDNDARAYPASVIEAVLCVWGGKPQSITDIVVVQAGRNAWIDEKTGSFDLHPRPEEWSKE